MVCKLIGRLFWCQNHKNFYQVFGFVWFGFGFGFGFGWLCLVLVGFVWLVKKIQMNWKPISPLNSFFF